MCACVWFFVCLWRTCWCQKSPKQKESCDGENYATTPTSGLSAKHQLNSEHLDRMHDIYKSVYGVRHGVLSLPKGTKVSLF